MKNIRSNFKYFLFLQIEKQYIHNYTNKINRNKTFNILLHVYIYIYIYKRYKVNIVHLFYLHMLKILSRFLIFLSGG